jgi:hypothetical protein
MNPFKVTKSIVETLSSTQKLSVSSGMIATSNLLPQSYLATLHSEKSSLLARIKVIDELLATNNVQSTHVQPHQSLSTTVFKNENNKASSTMINSKLKSSSISNCPYHFKVYVYDIPKTLLSVKYGEEARKNRTLHVCQKCILEQFALEYIIYDFFTQFCGRTENPDEADYFYLPLIRDAEYRIALENKHKYNRAPSLSEQALLDIIEKNDSTKWKQIFHITDKYWYRYGGGDHILTMPAPVTNLRHESSHRGYFHYMIHLQSPIFLGVEYSKSFVMEYPICTTQKNIVLPYPTTDPDFFSGKLFEGIPIVNEFYSVYVMSIYQ